LRTRPIVFYWIHLKGEERAAERKKKKKKEKKEIVCSLTLLLKRRGLTYSRRYFLFVTRPQMRIDYFPTPSKPNQTTCKSAAQARQQQDGIQKGSEDFSTEELSNSGQDRYKITSRSSKVVRAGRKEKGRRRSKVEREKLAGKFISNSKGICCMLFPS
jgi:hypothetical protein